MTPDSSCRVCLAIGCTYFMQVDTRDYWRCPQCEATMVDAMQLPNREAESAVYRLHRNEVHDAGYRQYLARLVEPLLERLPPAQSGLDFGCGPGPALASMLIGAGHPMTVYDPLFFDEPEHLNQCYDFITCTEVVEHFHQPHKEFAALDRMLKPGGWLAIMTTFQTDDAAFARWHYRRDPTHVVFYREATLQAIARRFQWRCEIPCKDVALLHKPVE